MARLQKKRKKKRELIGPDVPNVRNLGPSTIPNLSIVCPFCDEDSRVNNVYASYTRLLQDVDRDRVIITPQKIYYPRTCTMGHTFWTVECVPDRYDKMLEEIEELKEFTRHEMEEYRDSLAEAQIGYELTRGAKRKLERKKASAKRKKQREAEKKERQRIAKEEARIRRAEEKERIRQAKLDGTWVPPENQDWPVVTVLKTPGRKGYTVLTDEDIEARRRQAEEEERRKQAEIEAAEAERIRKRDEFLSTPGILHDTGSLNRYQGYDKVDKMLAARGLKRKCFADKDGE